VTEPAAVEELLTGLVPAGAAVAACKIDESRFEQLTADERALVGSARPVRRAEFAAGRACAHRALRVLGVDARTISRGPRRQPVWPEGVTGSISHTADLAATVVMRTTPSVASIGLDVEVAGQPDEELWVDLLTPTERTAVEASDDPQVAVTHVFTAKEAAFKALFPLLGVEIEYLDACVRLDADTTQGVVEAFGQCVTVRHGRVGENVVSVATVALLV
jgi:4'-phosphopantetheinyl transferase EntD